MGSANVINFKNKTTKINVNIDSLKSTKQKLNAMTSYSEFSDIDSILSERETKSIEKEQARIAAEEAAKKAKEEEERKAAEEKKKEEKKPWWDIVFDYTATAVGSVLCGVVDVAESIVDGVAMAGGTIASGVATLAGNEELANEIKKTTSDFVSYDFAESAYDATMDALDVDEEIAHGLVHDIGKGAGQIAGYAAITMVTGGAGTTIVSGLAAAGSSGEAALQSGATFDEAAIVSATSGVLGALSGGALEKLKKGAVGAKTLTDVARYTTTGTLVSTIEPVVNSVTEYETYGKDMVDEYGNKLYNSFGDYYLKGGGALNTFMAGAAGGVSTFSSAYKGYSNRGNKLAMDARERMKKQQMTDKKNLRLEQKKSNIDYVNGRRLSGNEIGEYKQKYIDMYSEKGYSKVELDEIRSKFNDISGQAQRLGQQYPDFDEKTFYEIVCMDRKKRPDPTTYLPKSIIADWETDFSNGKAYCVMATGTPASAFDNFVESKGCLGPPGETPDVKGFQYVIGESTKLKIDKIINSPGSLADKQIEIAKILGVPSKQFSDGFVLIERTIDDVNPIKMSSGSESTANDWYTPYGQTTAGVKEGVLPSVSGVQVGYDNNGKRFIKNEGIKIIYDTEG